MRQRPPVVALVLLLPMLLCTCCSGAFVAPAAVTLVGDLPLILFPSQAQGTITGVTPCQASLVIAATSPNGFTYTTADNDGVSITARYYDEQGRLRVGDSAICTHSQPGYAVGQAVTVAYQSGSPARILLASDLGALRGFVFFSVVLLGMFVLLAVMLIRSLRRRPRPPTIAPAYAPALGQPVQPVVGGWPEALLPPAPALPGGMPSPAYPLSETAQMLQRLSAEAIGPGNYPTTRLGLKEALFLLHARNTSPVMDDNINKAGKVRMMHDHMLVAAMLLDLLLQGRIVIEDAGGILHRKTIRVLDPSPVGDGDTDAFLAYLQTTDARLGQVYNYYARYHLVARLIDQLRQGGYLRLHIPTTGSFGRDRDIANMPLIGGFLQRLGRAGMAKGYTVTTDDFSRALPWGYLYTTQTPAEEALFARVQAAVTAGAATDDFTQALLVLVAALYMPNALFGSPARTNLYRFYPKEETKKLIAQLRGMAKHAPESWQPVYQLAKVTDERIENPPDAGG